MGGGEDLMKLIWLYKNGDDDHDDYDDGHVDGDGDKDYGDYVIVDDYYDDDNDSRVVAKSFIFPMSATRWDIMLTVAGWVAGNQVNIVIIWKQTIFRIIGTSVSTSQKSHHKNSGSYIIQSLRYS